MGFGIAARDILLEIHWFSQSRRRPILPFKTLLRHYAKQAPVLGEGLSRGLLHDCEERWIVCSSIFGIAAGDILWQ